VTDLEKAVAAAREAFEAAMDDDFNTPGALAALFDLATALNKARDEIARGAGAASPTRLGALEVACGVLRELGGVLGLRLAALVTAAQVAGLRRLAQELARERPDLFDPKHLEAIRVVTVVESDGEDVANAEKLIRFIAEGRMRARRQKDWATGDQIRARLQDLGVLLEDTPTGFKWRVR
jgi:cysteinyl-tRNA synthetase